MENKDPKFVRGWAGNAEDYNALKGIQTGNPQLDESLQIAQQNELENERVRKQDEADLEANRELGEKLIAGGNIRDVYHARSFANSYDRLTSEIYGEDLGDYMEIIDSLLDLTTYNPKDTVVDAGCGTGISIERILRRNPGRVIGVDFSEAMLEKAREKFKDTRNVEFRKAAIEELSDVVGDADKIVSANVFEYISDEDRALSQIYQALAQEGEYLFNLKIITPGAEKTIYSPMFRILGEVFNEKTGKTVEFPDIKGLEARHVSSDIEAMAERNGFSIVKYEEKPVVYNGTQLRSVYVAALGETERNIVEPLGEELAKGVIEETKSRLEDLYTSETFGVNMANVCLGK